MKVNCPFLKEAIKRETCVNHLVTTGKAAKMLRISLSTAMRYFDKGILTGEKTPITRQRRINRESVVSLMKEHGMDLED